MLLDNKKIISIKYQGTRTFIAGLFCEKSENGEKYFFGFTPTKEPVISINDNEEEFFSRGLPITRIGERRISFSVEGIPTGKTQKVFSLISIKPEEFDSLYKLLECIYND